MAHNNTVSDIGNHFPNWSPYNQWVSYVTHHRYDITPHITISQDWEVAIVKAASQLRYKAEHTTCSAARTELLNIANTLIEISNSICIQQAENFSKLK